MRWRSRNKAPVFAGSIRAARHRAERTAGWGSAPELRDRPRRGHVVEEVDRHVRHAADAPGRRAELFGEMVERGHRPLSIDQQEQSGRLPGARHEHGGHEDPVSRALLDGRLQVQLHRRPRGPGLSESLPGLGDLALGDRELGHQQEPSRLRGDGTRGEGGEPEGRWFVRGEQWFTPVERWFVRGGRLFFGVTDN